MPSIFPIITEAMTISFKNLSNAVCEWSYISGVSNRIMEQQIVL